MTDTEPSDDDEQTTAGGSQPGDRLTTEAERAIDAFDAGLVDILGWLLDTETRARIYIYLRTAPASTSEEIAAGTGLYPSTVRESLSTLHEEGIVTREKRSTDTAGNNPYAYTAIAPSDLVGDIAAEVQDQLNAICNLDRYLSGESETDTEPIRIEVTEENAGDAAK